MAVEVQTSKTTMVDGSRAASAGADLLACSRRRSTSNFGRAWDQTRMRWRDQADWIAPDRHTHEALIDVDLALAVRLRTIARRGPGLVCSRETSVSYALRGMLFCAACGRRMPGAARVGKRTTRVLYRCELGKSRSVPGDLSDHPRTVYLREDEVTARLDDWIATPADPEDLARGQDAYPAAGTGYAACVRGVEPPQSYLVRTLKLALAAEKHNCR